MKKTNKNIILKTMMAVGMVVLAFAPSYQALAWGPERETFRWETAAPYRTFNSITDNPSLGDERNFVRVRKVGDEKFSDEVDLVVGAEYEVEIYYHNNASRTLNASGAGIADGVRVSAILPEFVAKGATGELSGTIVAANTKPESVWDEAGVRANADVYLRYVSGSIEIHSGGTIDGQKLAAGNLFSAEGANVGYWNDAPGVVPGCNEYSGYVSYRFAVDQPRYEIAKEVSREGANEWKENITVEAGEMLEFRIRYKNTGTTEQNDVIVTDELPEWLKYVSGSTYLVNGSSPEGKYVSDALFDTGMNIGRYQPGSEAVLTYRVQMPGVDELNCGNNTFTNAASVATANGTMLDDVEIIVAKECVVTELPKTGPMEIAVMVVAVLAMGVGGVYWWRSSRALRDTQKAVGVEKDEEE